MQMLRTKLLQSKTQEDLEKRADIKRVQQKSEGGSQIGPDFCRPYTRVKDTRTAYETGNVNNVMDGDIDGFINAYLKALATGVWASKQ